MAIRILKPSLDDAMFEGNPVLRGVILPESLRELRIDRAYQREFLSPSTRRWIWTALMKNQRLPDIELGMRGEAFHFDGPDIILHDPVFIIDGQQRRGTILEYVARHPDAEIRQGGLIHFNTTFEWEEPRFHDLNAHHTNVASSLILRNRRNRSPALATIYGLSINDKTFPLYDRVGWEQSMLVKDLISGVAFCKYALLLHAYFTAGLASSSLDSTVIAFDKVEEIIGLQHFRNNVKEFWETVDEAWGLTALTKRGALWLKSTFLQALCMVISRHEDFWEDYTYNISSENLERFSTFPINDPEIIRLACSSGASRQALVYLMTEHMNKGRSRHRLTARDWAALTLERRIASARAAKKGPGPQPSAGY